MTEIAELATKNHLQAETLAASVTRARLHKQHIAYLLDATRIHSKAPLPQQLNLSYALMKAYSRAEPGCEVCPERGAERFFSLCILHRNPMQRTDMSISALAGKLYQDLPNLSVVNGYRPVLQVELCVEVLSKRYPNEANSS